MIMIDENSITSHRLQTSFLAIDTLEQQLTYFTHTPQQSQQSLFLKMVAWKDESDSTCEKT